ncbi:hypothetical protein AVEN_224335-1 [Araneus ventricosus]|uniref:Uncharacterized protein n=1 Tax=Araneus ventricosus TaxID=182803 RepID=A0A4Y2WMN6_ARAVE|nr:hypothetical protein AVEN_224335-1 [Araneus ventricosus]
MGPEEQWHHYYTHLESEVPFTYPAASQPHTRGASGGFVRIRNILQDKHRNRRSVGSEIARELRKRRVHPSHRAVTKSSDLNKWFWRCGEMRMCFPLALETCRSLAGVLLFSVQADPTLFNV